MADDMTITKVNEDVYQQQEESTRVEESTKNLPPEKSWDSSADEGEAIRNIDESIGTNVNMLG